MVFQKCSKLQYVQPYGDTPGGYCSTQLILSCSHPDDVKSWHISPWVTFGFQHIRSETAFPNSAHSSIQALDIATKRGEDTSRT